MPRSKYPYELPEHKVEHGVLLTVKDLKIDPQAQRTLNEKRAQGIADNLVREAMGSVVASRRDDGDTYLVDGMHRARVCELKDIEHITGEVHYGLTRKEEAILFLIKNRESSKPNPLDEYKVGLTAGLELFVDTEAVLKRHGLEMGSTSTNSVGAVSGVLRITDQYGPEVLDRTLSVAEGAWGRTPSTWDGMLLGGIGAVLGRHGEIIDDADFAMKIARTGHAQGWIGKVHSVASGGGLHNSGTGSRVQTCYALMVQTWNKGKRKNLIPTP